MLLIVIIIITKAKNWF